MAASSNVATSNGHFLVRKSIFLLASSVGKAVAETIINQAIEQIGRSPSLLTEADIPGLSVKVKPALAKFVGEEKAERLTSALRVLVGGMVTK
jgi:hypothetical protein